MTKVNNDKEGNSNRFIFLNIYFNRTLVLFKSKLNKFRLQLHHQIIVHGYFRITIQFKHRINQIFSKGMKYPESSAFC